MDLISALAELENSVNAGLDCSVSVVLKSLDGKEQTALNKAIENKNIPAPHIYKALQDNGHKLSLATIYKHRRKQCRCFNEKQ